MAAPPVPLLPPPLVLPPPEPQVGGEVVHKCQYCSKHYSSSHSLRTHEKWHRGDLNHPCSHCDKKFRNPSEVRRHEMTHTGEKPHPCPQCNMKFIQKASLRDHLEKKHPSTPPPLHAIPFTQQPVFSQIVLNCKYCQKQFGDPAALAQHEESELHDFELLHQTFEQVELQEIGMGALGLQEYLAPQTLQPLPDLQMKSDSLSIPALHIANNNLQQKPFQAKDQEEEVVISQFFEELEGQYPHLRGELGKVLSDTDSSSSLSSSSPRHSATPVDTIPASSGWSPASNLQLEPSFLTPVTTDTVPVIHITPLPADLHSTTGLAYQDDLNNFCEGILSQLGTSAWAEELNLGPDMAETSLPPSQEVVYRTISLPAPNTQFSVHPVPTTSSRTSFPPFDSDLWETEKTNLPPGWKTRVVEAMVGTRQIKRAEFLSPAGQHFPSRKTALDHMIRNGSYPPDDLECMRRGLRTKTNFEWETGRPGVPLGWKTREKLSSDGKVRVFYLSPGGISFPCRQAALDHMASDGAYSSEDVEMMRVGAGARRSRGQGEFVSGDPSLPPGWLVRMGANGRQSFRCPRGVFHASRASVVGSLEAAGAPSSQVELVRGSLAPGRRRRKRRVGEEEWVTGDPSLPAGWRIRLVDCSDGHAVTFLQTPQGVKLKGRKAGLAHVLQHPAVFSQSDVEVMKDSLNIVSKVTEAWEEGDLSLPPGWRIKRYKSKTENRRVHCEFLSPGMRVFRSRRAVADHLREQGAPEEQLARLEAGSSTASSFPSAAFSPTPSPSAPAYTATPQPPAPEPAVPRSTILPPSQPPHQLALLPGRPVVLEAKQELKESSFDSGKVVVQESKAVVKPKTGEVTWKTCTSLPTDWKTRTVFWSDREKPLYLSPVGRTLTSRKAVLAAMEAMGGYSHEEFDRVKKAVGKRKKKSSNHWVPTKRKGRRKGLVKGAAEAMLNVEDVGLSVADEFVGYFDGEARVKMRPCIVTIPTIPLDEEVVKRAAESLHPTDLHPNSSDEMRDAAESQLDPMPTSQLCPNLPLGDAAHETDVQ